MSTTTQTANRIVRPSGKLGRRIAGARRSLISVEFCRRAAITLAVAVGLLALLMLADWYSEFSLGSRKALLATAGIATGLLAAWTLAGLVTQRRSDDEIALMVERKNPKFNSRLISAVQFGEGKAAVPDGAPVEMVKAMVAETEKEARGERFGRIVDPRKLARAILVLLTVAVAAGVGAFVMRDHLAVLFGRAFGKDVAIPRETRIVEASGDMRIGIGDGVELAFTVEGVMPDAGELSLRFATGGRQTLELVADEATPGRYTAALEDVPETFEFRAKINDARSEKATVTALERPTVESLSGTQTYPGFTGLQPTQHAPGDFALFPGGELAITLTATKPLSSGELRFIGLEGGLDLEISKDNPRTATAVLDIPSADLVGFTVALTDTEEMESKDNTVYRVSLLADRAPEIRITLPRRAEELVTRKARVLVKYEATDRFGIAAVNLRYRRSEEEPGTIAADIPSDAPKAINGSLEWRLADLEPSVVEGDTIEFWLEAADQNAGGANIGVSERLLLRVVTPEEKRADLLGRASDAIGGVGEATSDQERLNRDLETLIRDNANAPRAPRPPPDPPN